MATYADSDILLMERTAAVATPNSAVMTTLTIPTIAATGKTPIRPLFFEIRESTGDFNVRVDDDTSVGVLMAVVGADLSYANPLLIPIEPDTIIKLSDAAGGAMTVDVRWIYPASSKSGMPCGVPHASQMKTKTFSFSVTNVAGNLTIPADAVEMVLMASAGGGTTPGVTYGVGASGNPTPILDVAAGSISYGAPARIFVADDDVVRMVRLGNTNQTIYGYWRLK